MACPCVRDLGLWPRPIEAHGLAAELGGDGLELIVEPLRRLRVADLVAGEGGELAAPGDVGVAADGEAVGLGLGLDFGCLFGLGL